MFFTPTLKYDWFYVHKVIQCFMVFLIVAMVFTPLFYQEKEAEAVPLVAIGVAVGAAAVIVQVWVYLDGVCDGCGVGREALHYVRCDHCKSDDYNCPLWKNHWNPHMHQSRCGACKGVYWDCDGESNYYNALMYVPQVHGLAQCFVCDGEVYRICTDGKEHVHGTGGSGYCGSGYCGSGYCGSGYFSGSGSG